MRTLSSAFGIVVLLSTLVLGSGPPVLAKEYYKMSTLAPGSTIYVITAGFAQATNKYLPQYEIQLKSAGSAARHMLDGARGKIDFFMSSTILAYFMTIGKGMYKKVKDAPALAKNLRSIFNFPVGSWQIVVYEESGIRTFKDIKGEKVFLGPPSGGATALATAIVEGASGYRAGKEFAVARMGFAAAQQAFQDRKIDVWAYPSLVPGAGLQQIALTNKIRLLSLKREDFDKPKIKKVMSLPGRTREIIPPDAYGSNQMNKEPVLAVGAWIGVGCRKGLPEKVVYETTKAFWEHIEDLHAQGKALQTINLQTALRELNLPLHPGALRYYQEKGLKIPGQAIPKE